MRWWGGSCPYRRRVLGQVTLWLSLLLREMGASPVSITSRHLVKPVTESTAWLWGLTGNLCGAFPGIPEGQGAHLSDPLESAPHPIPYGKLPPEAPGGGPHQRLCQSDFLGAQLRVAGVRLGRWELELSPGDRWAAIQDQVQSHGRPGVTPTAHAT